MTNCDHCGEPLAEDSANEGTHATCSGPSPEAEGAEGTPSPLPDPEPAPSPEENPIRDEPVSSPEETRIHDVDPLSDDEPDPSPEEISVFARRADDSAAGRRASSPVPGSAPSPTTSSTEHPAYRGFFVDDTETDHPTPLYTPPRIHTQGTGAPLLPPPPMKEERKHKKPTGLILLVAAGLAVLLIAGFFAFTPFLRNNTEPLPPQASPAPTVAASPSVSEPPSPTPTATQSPSVSPSPSPSPSSPTTPSSPSFLLLVTYIIED